MNLTDREKELIKAMINRGEPLPAKYRDDLFGNIRSETAYQRYTNFNNKFTELKGLYWTAFHSPSADGKYDPPSNQIQIAWPWRREIYYAYFFCRRSIGYAYTRYQGSLHSGGEVWSEIQCKLERSMHLAAALVFHNAFEEKIAQLANRFLPSPFDEERVEAKKIFQQPAPVDFVKTWKVAKRIVSNDVWRKVHKLANEVKHCWLGGIVDHNNRPKDVESELADIISKSGSNRPYLAYGGLREVTDEEIDNWCILIQESLNLLCNLAKILDDDMKAKRWIRVFTMTEKTNTVTAGASKAER